MRVGIITFGGDGGKSGISHYIIRLLAEFSVMETDMEFEVIAYANEQDIFIPPKTNLIPVPYGERLRNPVVNVAWHQLELPFVCRKRGYDILFLPAANRRMPYWVPCPTVGTVHDFSSTHVKDKYDPARMFFIKKVTPVLIRKLDMILTVSENSKKDIMNFCGISGDRIVVTPNGVDLSIYSPGDREVAIQIIKNKYHFEPPCFLYVSRIEHPGKNHVRLIQAFDALKKRTKIPHQLILAGSAWSGADEVMKAAEEAQFRQDIKFIGFVAGEDLPNLYRTADIFVFPSLYEGFGMPLLEAMACGTPVVCSNLSSMPEVAGDAALLFDPYDEEDMSAKLQKLVEDDLLRSDLVAKGFNRAKIFSWTSTARQTLDVIASTWKAYQ
jgi:glycosyltransferase involved in cell wall biosynthesis